MQVYLGGEIEEHCRGPLAIVINREKVDDVLAEQYSCFVYPIVSEEFIHLTGMYTARAQLVRVYAGVSQEAGDYVASLTNGTQRTSLDLDSIDRHVVEPHFLDVRPEAPRDLTLHLGRGGYKIVDAQAPK